MSCDCHLTLYVPEEIKDRVKVHYYKKYLGIDEIELAVLGAGSELLFEYGLKDGYQKFGTFHWYAHSIKDSYCRILEEVVSGFPNVYGWYNDDGGMECMVALSDWKQLELFDKGTRGGWKNYHKFTMKVHHKYRLEAEEMKQPQEMITYQIEQIEQKIKKAKEYYRIHVKGELPF